MTVGVDLLRMALLNNVGQHNDDPSNKKDSAPWEKTERWKNDCVEVTTCGSGSDTTHCYPTFIETESLIGNGAAGYADSPVRHKNDCAEVIAGCDGTKMTHCYAAFTETEDLIGRAASGYTDKNAHFKNDCAELIASGGGCGNMTHCYAAFTDTESLLGKIGAGYADESAHFKNNCAEVIANDCGEHMTHCYAAFNETDSLIGAASGGEPGPARFKNDCAEVIASGGARNIAHCYAAFTETENLIGKAVSGYESGLAHWMHNRKGETTGEGLGALDPEKMDSLAIFVKDYKAELVFCCAVLHAVATMMESALVCGNYSDDPASTECGSKGSADEVGPNSEEGYMRVSHDLNLARGKLRECSQQHTKRHSPTHCCSIACASEMQAMLPTFTEVGCTS